MRERLPVSERFWQKVDVTTPNGCWIWNSTTWPNGYGCFRLKGKNVRAHRFAYEERVGPIPEGLQIDHLCRVRNCVNPAHLEPVTQVENLRRGWRARDRHDKCGRGHIFTEENTLPKKGGQRECRKCKAIRWQARKLRLHVKQAAILAVLVLTVTASAAAGTNASSTRRIICGVFGPYCQQALRVSWCESRWSTTASNGQYLGLFQMGDYARSRYGHGADAWTQAEAAFRYFADSGFNWGPWSCRP